MLSRWFFQYPSDYFLSLFSCEGFILSDRHDRTTGRIAMCLEFNLTGREMTSERATKIFHSCHLAVQLTYLLIPQITNPPALFSPARSQKSFDFVQRQT